MCLMSKQEKPFIAKEDILTYKLLLKNERGEYFTPYFGKVVKLGETLYGGDIDVEYNSESNGLFNEIGSGYVHSYVNPFGEWNTAHEKFWLFDFRFDYRDCTCVLVKCVIPKGVEYYIDSDMECIASKELVIGEEEEEGFDSKVSTNFGKFANLTYEYSSSTLEDEYEGKKKGIYLSYLKDRYEALSNEEKETIGRIIIEDNDGNIIKEINPFESFSISNEDKELIKGIIEEGEFNLRIGITYNSNKDYVYIPYKAQGYGINPFEMEEDVVEFINVNLGKDKVSKPTLDDLTEVAKVLDILNCIILLYCLKDTRLLISSKLYFLSDDNNGYAYTRLYNLQHMINIEVVSCTYIFIKKN